MIYIDGTLLPYPTKYNVNVSDLDSSDTTRNEAGVLVRNRVRAGITKIELAFTVRGDVASTILKLIEPAQFHVKYYDPRASVYREITAYVGDRSTTMRVYTPGMEISDIWWDVAFNLIEY